jgi:hypothetical protein
LTCSDTLLFIDPYGELRGSEVFAATFEFFNMFINVVQHEQYIQIQIMHAEEYQRPDFNQMLSTVWYLFRRFGKINKIYIDGSNPSFIRALKIQIGEDEEYEEIIKEAKSRKRNYEHDMDVVPVNFSTEHKSMLGNCKMLLEREGGYIAINPKFDKLITSLRTAVENDGILDKEATSYDDVFDAFRLALCFYRFSESIRRPD